MDKETALEALSHTTGPLDERGGPARGDWVLRVSSMPTCAANLLGPRKGL